MLEAESDDLFRATFEKISAGMVITDTEGRFLRVNAAFCNFLGYTEDELLKLRLLDVTHLDDRARIQQNFSEVIAGLRQSIDVQKRYIRKDGAIVWVRATAVCLRDEHANPIYCVAVMQDITEYQRAEESFRLAVEWAPNGMAMVNEEGRIILVNSQTERMFGYSRKELLGQSVEQLLPERFRPGHPAHRASFAATPEARPMGVGRDLYGRRKDGSEFPVEIGLNPIETERGVWALSSIVDITERKRNEVAMAQLAAIVDSSNDAIVGCKTQDGTVVSWNAAAERIFGYSADEVKGRSISILVPPDRRDEASQILERLKRGEHVEHFETVRVRKNGKQINVSITFSPIKDASGKIIGSSAIARDITERQRTEAALRESEAHYRAVSESAPNAFVVADSAGRIVTWNKAAQRMFQHAEEEVLGQPLTLIMPERYRRAYQEGRQRYLRTGIPGNIGKATEMHGLRKDGTEFPLEVSLSSWKTEQGEFYHGIIRDTTERNRAEEQLRSSSEQLRALAVRLQSVREEERTRLAREIHDGLSPALTALTMDLSWLSNGLTVEQKALLEKAKSMSQLIDTTIQSVRKIATELRPGVLDDLGLAAAIEWQAQEFQARTGIRCSLSVLPRAITLDPLRSTAIFRICQELLTNVARHSHASRVKISLEEKPGDMTLEVRDNGKGIAESEISSSKSLGLLGMRERALLFGGELKIGGAPGKGTRVTVRIPL